MSLVSRLNILSSINTQQLARLSRYIFYPMFQITLSLRCLTLNLLFYLLFMSQRRYWTLILTHPVGHIIPAAGARAAAGERSTVTNIFIPRSIHLYQIQITNSRSFLQGGKQAILSYKKCFILYGVLGS